MDFKLCILTPTTGFTRIDYSMSLYKLTCTFMTQKVCDGKQAIGYHAIEGSGVSANREKLIDMSADSTHILFIDEDMGYEPDALFLLMKRKKSVVGCNYKTKIENGNFMAMALDRKERMSLNNIKTGIEPVYYTGFGFCLIERSVFDKIEKPWFLHKYKDGIEQGGRCAICGIHQSELNRRLGVDHCHETKNIRGLLCHKCNVGIGYFNDNIELLRNVIKYLEMAGKQ